MAAEFAKNANSQTFFSRYHILLQSKDTFQQTANAQKQKSKASSQTGLCLFIEFCQSDTEKKTEMNFFEISGFVFFSFAVFLSELQTQLGLDHGTVLVRCILVLLVRNLVGVAQLLFDDLPKKG